MEVKLRRVLTAELTADIKTKIATATEQIKNMKRNDVVDDTAAFLLDTAFKAGNFNVTKNTWLGDSGASCHMTCSNEGMFDVRINKSSIQIGDGQGLAATKIGKKRLTVVHEDGTTTDIVLSECKFVPKLWVNLFSITKALEHDFDIANKGLVISLSKGNTKISFDKIFKTECGQVVGVEMLPKNDWANVLFEDRREVEYNVLHKALGHAHEDSVRKTAAYYSKSKRYTD